MPDRDVFHEFGVAVFGFLAGITILASLAYQFFRWEAGALVAVSDALGADFVRDAARAVSERAFKAYIESSETPGRATFLNALLDDPDPAPGVERIDLSDISDPGGLADELGLDVKSLDLEDIIDDGGEGFDIDFGDDDRDIDDDVV